MCSWDNARLRKPATSQTQRLAAIFTGQRIVKEKSKTYDVDSAIELIVNSDSELKERWERYIHEEYGDNTDTSTRLIYTDIGEVSRFIIEKFKTNQTENFEVIFSNIESILTNCDHRTKEFITIGLFEGIQNISGGEIDYYFGFNKWLYTLSGEQWRAVIDFWEGKDWRTTKRPK